MEDARLVLSREDLAVTTSDQPHAHGSSEPHTGRGMSTGDVVAGVSSLLLETAGSAARTARPLLGALGSIALRPPLVPSQLQPAQLLAPVADRLVPVADRGAAQRRALVQAVSRRLDELVPQVLAEVLRRARPTELVLRYVDLDEVVAAVDLDEAAARLDVERVVDRVDVDRVVSRADLDAILAQVDLDEVVGRVDVDAVARRLDLDAVLDRPDFTATILRHLDLDALVEAFLAHIDMIALAEEVIDGVDLPEIIRDSTGTMASDTVRGARMQGIAADEAVGRAVDRLLLRRGRRATGAVAPETMTSPAPQATVPYQERRGTPR